jgi:hyperosmotically inducible periplasmic protein
MKPRLMGAIVLSVALALPEVALAQISDAALGERIADAILKYSKFSIFDDVNVAVDNRNVTLLGRVTSPQKKDEIEKRVAKIDGIRTLQNEIGVLPLSQQDSRLRNSVASAIYGHPAFWQYGQLANPPVHIIIENSHITLTGEVGSQVDSMLAYSLAQVSGALSITNKIRVTRR